MAPNAGLPNLVGEGMSKSIATHLAHATMLVNAERWTPREEKINDSKQLT